MASTFTVVACGHEPARLTAHPDHRRVLTLPDPGREGFLDEALNVLNSQPTRFPLLFVHAHGRRQEHELGVLRALARKHRVVGVSVEVPPTGLSARSTWLAALAARGVPAGVAIASLRREPGILETRIVVSSVAGLTVPGVTFGQHLASWVPGMTLAGWLDDAAHLSTGRAPEHQPLFQDVDRVVDGQDRLASRVAVPGLNIAQSVPLGTVDDNVRWWGRSTYYEETLVPRNVDTVVAHLSRQPFGRCVHCGGATSGSCPFCSAREELVA